MHLVRSETVLDVVVVQLKDRIGYLYLYKRNACAERFRFFGYDILFNTRFETFFALCVLGITLLAFSVNVPSVCCFAVLHSPLLHDRVTKL